MVKSDIEIAREARMKPIMEIGAGLGIPSESLMPYGHTKAKIDLGYIDSLKDRPDGKLILVTGINPTAAGEGKTTTTVGLGDALNRIGKKAAICLREPSLGPCFGVKGGAAGGGYAQVVPMEDINLHFTGDFHAIAAANNLLAALIDNHVYWGNALGLDPRRISWRRALDMNDRALRSIVNSLGGVANGFPREDGFDIVVASEIMAILCLSTDLDDLKRRLGAVNWPHDYANESWEYGTPTAYLRELCETWRDGFDWRAQEAAMNAHDHYRVEIDGIPIHYVHARGKGANPVPLDVPKLKQMFEDAFEGKLK